MIVIVKVMLTIITIIITIRRSVFFFSFSFGVKATDRTRVAKIR